MPSHTPWVRHYNVGLPIILHQNRKKKNREKAFVHVYVYMPLSLWSSYKDNSVHAGAVYYTGNTVYKLSCLPNGEQRIDSVHPCLGRSSARCIFPLLSLHTPKQVSSTRGW